MLHSMCARVQVYCAFPSYVDTLPPPVEFDVSPTPPPAPYPAHIVGSRTIGKRAYIMEGRHKAKVCRVKAISHKEATVLIDNASFGESSVNVDRKNLLR